MKLNTSRNGVVDAVISTIIGISIGTGVILLGIDVYAAKSENLVLKQKVKNSVEVQFDAAPYSKSIFMVMPWTPQRARGGGTGFLVSTPYYGMVVITNRHICDASKLGMFYLISQGRYYTARGIAVSNTDDLCMIQAPDELQEDFIPLNLSERQLHFNELVRVVGHPHLRPLTVTYGHFLNISTEPLDMMGVFTPDMLVTIGKIDALIVPGNSGSPVLNLDGEVAGVVFAYDLRDSNSLFVPLKNLKTFIRLVR